MYNLVIDSRCLMILSPPSHHRQPDITPGTDSHLMNHGSSFPCTASALRNTDNLPCNPIRQSAFFPLFRAAQYPLHSRPSSLLYAQRDRNGKRRTTAHDTPLLSNLDQWGHGVDRCSQVLYGR
jgi:hypothetical protein